MVEEEAPAAQAKGTEMASPELVPAQVSVTSVFEQIGMWILGLFIGLGTRIANLGRWIVGGFRKLFRFLRNPGQSLIRIARRMRESSETMAREMDLLSWIQLIASPETAKFRNSLESFLQIMNAVDNILDVVLLRSGIIQTIRVSASQS